MAVSMNATLRNNRLDQITSFAGASAKLRVYTAGGATLLYEALCNATFAPAASGGVLTANAIGNATATNAGTAALARLYKNDGTTLVLDGLSVGTSGTNVVITNTVIAVNDVVTTSSLTITEGNP
jgi:hypothetical protein